MNKVVKTGLVVAGAALVVSSTALAGICQGTSAAWTTNQTTCGARSLYAQGFNAGGGFSKHLKVNRTSTATIGVGAQAVNSAGGAIASCTITDTDTDWLNGQITTNGCSPGVKFIYQVSW
jgi:hypothetical protein